MRTRIVFFMGVAIAACMIGCGSDDETPAETPGATGGAGGTEAGLGGTGGAMGGTGGAMGGAGGTAGVDASTGGAGGATGGAAGTDGGQEAEAAAGASGTGGTGGTGGAGGTGGTTVVDLCVGKTPQPALPYSIAPDFTNRNNIQGEATYKKWVVLSSPDCDMVFPDSGYPAPPAGFAPAQPPEQDAGVDAAADAVADAADDVVDGSADDGAAEAGLDDAEASAGDGSTDASADGGGNDASPPTDAAVTDATDAGGAAACWGFYYNPDSCAAYVADGGALQLWQCWAGVIFTPNVAGGVCIADGATTLEFWARASRVDARVKFGTTASSETVPGTETFVLIDTTWKKYSIPITPGYRATGGVTNGLSVVVEPQDHTGGTYIFVKDATWVDSTADGG
jgi:hypothetical protein